MIDLPAALRLYLVADPDHVDGDLIEVVEKALMGGVTMVQLRAKGLRDLEHLNLATTLARLCQAFNVPFLVNDRVDIALAVHAQGVHLGVDDLPLEAARRIGGDNLILGFSPDTDDHLRSAADRGADYLGIGPVFGTMTKNDAGAALGLDVFADRIKIGGLPVVGIGGIRAENAGDVTAAGADGVAVVSAILAAADPEGAARQISRNS